MLVLLFEKVVIVARAVVSVSMVRKCYLLLFYAACKSIYIVVVLLLASM